MKAREERARERLKLSFIPSKQQRRKSFISGGEAANLSLSLYLSFTQSFCLSIHFSKVARSLVGWRCNKFASSHSAVITCLMSVESMRRKKKLCRKCGKLDGGGIALFGAKSRSLKCTLVGCPSFPPTTGSGNARCV